MNPDDTVQIFLNGIEQRPGKLDYEIDYSTGMIDMEALRPKGDPIRFTYTKRHQVEEFVDALVEDEAS